eukprot:1246579-Pyramimonas_sp.AAC.1
MPCSAAVRDHWDWQITPEGSVCTACFKSVTGCPKRFLQNAKQWVVDGHTSIPETEPEAQIHNSFRAKTQEQHVDGWLNYIHHHLAEFRADIRVNTADKPDSSRTVADYVSEIPQPACLPAAGETGDTK